MSKLSKPNQLHPNSIALSKLIQAHPNFIQTYPGSSKLHPNSSQLIQGFFLHWWRTPRGTVNKPRPAKLITTKKTSTHNTNPHTLTTTHPSHHHINTTPRIIRPPPTSGPPALIIQLKPSLCKRKPFQHVRPTQPVNLEKSKSPMGRLHWKGFAFLKLKPNRAGLRP